MSRSADSPMNGFKTVLLVGAAFVAVFGEAAFRGLRPLLGAQMDFLPALMVYAGLRAGLTTVVVLAICGGLWLDSLSANPLGISVLALLAVGLGIYVSRELILREQPLAQAVLGLAASTGAAVLTLLLLLTTGHKPLLGWGTLWQVAVMSAGGGLATPACFVVFDWLQGWLADRQGGETSFRPDRELRRGRR